MSNIIVKENETLDSALRRFKRSCAKAGIQQEIRKREHYEDFFSQDIRIVKKSPSDGITLRQNGKMPRMRPAAGEESCKAGFRFANFHST